MQKRNPLMGWVANLSCMLPLKQGSPVWLIAGVLDSYGGKAAPRIVLDPFDVYGYVDVCVVSYKTDLAIITSPSGIP